MMYLAHALVTGVLIYAIMFGMYKAGLYNFTTCFPQPQICLSSAVNVT